MWPFHCDVQLAVDTLSPLCHFLVWYYPITKGWPSPNVLIFQLLVSYREEKRNIGEETKTTPALPIRHRTVRMLFGNEIMGGKSININLYREKNEKYTNNILVYFLIYLMYSSVVKLLFQSNDGEELPVQLGW